MKMKLLAASLAAISCAFAMTIVSCNSDDSVADVPSQPTHDDRGAQILGGPCQGILPVLRCDLGTATNSFDQMTGVFSVTGSNNLTSGTKSTFPASHNWHQRIASSAPQGAAQMLSAVAYDNGIRQARLDITQDIANPAQTILTPTFDAGNGTYQVEVLNNGQQVGIQTGVPPGSFAKVTITITFETWWGFVTISVTIGNTHQKGASPNAIATEAGACAWVFGGSGEATTQYTLPNGMIVLGDEIRFIEEVDGSGRYPYHSVNRIDVLSNLGTYDIRSETASQ